MTRRDYYDVLGVGRQATRLEIRRVYRGLARQYSPDVNVWERRGPELFEEIVEAYRVLSDPAARASYDRLGHRAFEPAPGTRADSRARRGDDLHYPIDIDLEEALGGFSTILEVTRQTRCSACRDPDGADGAGAAQCPACEGWPLRIVTRRGTPEVVRCEACGATGRQSQEPCATCGNRGTIPRQARVEVVIPPGVDTGAQIRVRGEGHALPDSDLRGDLVVIPRVRPHPFFTRKGDNLYCEVPITIPEAVLGARIHVPTPDGPGVITIPPGTQSGQTLRVRARGCPRLDRGGRGDLFVSTRVDIPRNADSTLEGALRALQRLLPEDPRAELWAGRKGAR